MEKLNDKVRKYLEYEIFHYNQYKKDLEEARMDIIETSPNHDMGMPASPNHGNEGQTAKVYMLMTNNTILRLEKIINAIDYIVHKLEPKYKEFYDKYFIRYSRMNREEKMMKITIEMYISERTYYYFLNRIINDLARELGYL